MLLRVPLLESLSCCLSKVGFGNVERVNTGGKVCESKMHEHAQALQPSQINFVPLKQVKSFRADELMEFYKSDMKLKKFLHIIENSPVFRVIYDCNRDVLSLPPIINGAHSAITLKTKNVFIECTATDLTKAKIVLNTMVTMFSVYCERKFEIEPVEVKYSDGKCVYPDLSVSKMEVPLSYITHSIGVYLEASQVTGLLNKMQLHAEQSVSRDEQRGIIVSVPPTRSNVLHVCDVMEDVAIAYGFNKIPKTKPASLQPVPLNQLSDLIRLEVVRTSLMPGILKTVGHNKDHPKPIKVEGFGIQIGVLEQKGFRQNGREKGHTPRGDMPTFFESRSWSNVYENRSHIKAKTRSNFWQDGYEVLLFLAWGCLGFPSLSQGSTMWLVYQTRGAECPGSMEFVAGCHLLQHLITCPLCKELFGLA
ncbi:hypothetical protein HHK36_029846 [Tetracentron sinense]|uniref:phenylalanine--tRNA ligase n=1 Tax=Tetracentron sinense TaxID=13715 RepID=A0A834YFI5_TETSI|nr:hypothetical protein HHK36_029846 [Tetracentron sinense]